MNIFKNFSKTLSKSINKSVIIYNNNTRLIRQKKKNFEKHFLSEFKEYAYEIVCFLETRKGWWVKIWALFFLFYPALQRSYWVLNGHKYKMLYSSHVINQLKVYQIEDMTDNDEDKNNSNKILYSYWTNYL